MNNQRQISGEQARADCYRLLAACFYPPQKDVFEAEGLFKNLAASLQLAIPEAASSARDLEEAFLKCSEAELNVAYAKLFVGPGELLAPPYGSVYLDEGRRVMGESTTRVTEAYRAEGLVLDEHYKDLPDHISAELEFMYFLAHKEIVALQQDNTAKAAYFLSRRVEFQRTLLGSWIVPFCEKIKQGTENGFYRALADCLSRVMERTGAGHAMPEELRVNMART